mmetsp:Transcript_31402/g.78808  ORF Transcript_31402/g.78808 Transcript_31402/m.78808 type:complete len:249 (+) Transcript_31402:2225-2971(+)
MRKRPATCGLWTVGGVEAGAMVAGVVRDMIVYLSQFCRNPRIFIRCVENFAFKHEQSNKSWTPKSPAPPRGVAALSGLRHARGATRCARGAEPGTNVRNVVPLAKVRGGGLALVGELAGGAVVVGLGAGTAAAVVSAVTLAVVAVVVAAADAVVVEGACDTGVSVAASVALVSGLALVVAGDEIDRGGPRGRLRDFRFPDGLVLLVLVLVGKRMIAHAHHGVRRRPTPIFRREKNVLRGIDKTCAEHT